MAPPPPPPPPPPALGEKSTGTSHTRTCPAVSPERKTGREVLGSAGAPLLPGAPLQAAACE